MSVVLPLTLRLALLLSLTVPQQQARAADWPTFRGDAARSGYTEEAIPRELQSVWTRRQSHVPQPAWPRSQQRLGFDAVSQPIIANGVVYFGDNVEGTVTAVDLNSGIERWIHVTSGPVRFAPAAWQDRIFVVSDDGCLYALSQLDGSLIWKHRGGPAASWRLGNERMISRWPARGGPLVLDDTVYFGAGIWPSDGIFLRALNAASGEPVWSNEDSGSLYMPQPHGGADAESGVAIQGYLVAASVGQTAGAADDGHGAAGRPAESSNWLLVPTGRAVPAAFDRDTGEFRYFHLQRYGQKGGAAIVAAESMFFNSGMVFDTASGEASSTIGDGPIAVTPAGLVRAADGTVTGYRWIDSEKKDRRGNMVPAKALEALWAVDGLHTGTEMIATGELVVLGGVGKVSVIDSTAGRVVWTAEVDGICRGLAAADGHLLVSTTQGLLYCFAAAGTEVRPATAEVAKNGDKKRKLPEENAAQENAALAASILGRTGILDGFCLDLGCGDGRLALELARQSNLHVIAVETDPGLLAAARRRLQDNQLLGSRISVLPAATLQETGLPNYFANLIVSGRSSAEGVDVVPEAEATRLLRPWGGTLLLGTPERELFFVRGPLEGSGSWTHQYADAANSLCSTDQYLQGPLGMLWFRDIELDMPQRHGRGPGPLFLDGLLYSEGLDELACVDAYNGRLLWKFPLPGILDAYNGDELMGTAGTHSNYCVAESGVYVRRDDYCLRIDRRTGELLGKLFAPRSTDSKPSLWGFIACEGGLVLGTVADPEHVVTFRYLDRGGDMKAQLTESRSLFALDAESGELKWKYDARHSIRHNAIALAAGTVYLIDRPQALFDRTKTKVAEEHQPGVLLALDVESGQQRWSVEHQIDGTTLLLSEAHDTLLMSHQPARFALVSEVGGRLTAFSTQDGAMRWQRQADYASRPLINERTIYAQGGAWDLLTGETREFNFSRSYGCGALAGTTHMMVYRSATLGYFDLQRNERTENFGGVRPGCWINAIPAGGLVLVPDASAGCVCSYLNQTWFALEPDNTKFHGIRLRSGTE